jgi:hydrogenase maturation protease
MNQPRILIAGIGNIFCGDDAFGVAVTRYLGGRGMPDGVRVIDFGIRGLDLAYALFENYDVAILVDTVQMGGAAGTLYLIEPDLDRAGLTSNTLEAHALDPFRVLGLARSMGNAVERVLLVGCEPAVLEDDEGRMELSEPVQAAVPQAARLIDSVIAKIHAGEPIAVAMVE